MSRIRVVIVLVMLVLAGAIGLKNIVTAHSDGSVMVANGMPAPHTPW